MVKSRADCFHLCHRQQAWEPWGADVPCCQQNRLVVGILGGLHVPLQSIVVRLTIRDHAVTRVQGCNLLWPREHQPMMSGEKQGGMIREKDQALGSMRCQCPAMNAEMIENVRRRDREARIVAAADLPTRAAAVAGRDPLRHRWFFAKAAVIIGRAS